MEPPVPWLNLHHVFWKQPVGAHAWGCRCWSGNISKANAHTVPLSLQLRWHGEHPSRQSRADGLGLARRL